MEHQWRPNLTSHEQLAKEIASVINQEALYPLTETDIAKLALERMWKDAHIGQPYPKALKRKKYIRLQF